MSAKRNAQVILTLEQADFLLEELMDHNKKFLGLLPASPTVQARTKGLRDIIETIKAQKEAQ